jgi:hypothetical protein
MGLADGQEFTVTVTQKSFIKDAYFVSGRDFCYARHGGHAADKLSDASHA